MRSALRELSESGRGDVRRLTNIDPPEWRLRIGSVRVRFAYIKQDGVILVLRVLPRGKAYDR